MGGSLRRGIGSDENIDAEAVSRHPPRRRHGKLWEWLVPTLAPNHVNTTVNPLRHATLSLCFLAIAVPDLDAADTRFAHSDGNARFPHRIDLYDSANRKITVDSDQPYSSWRTCGRCHDYQTISHGWHFNAFDPAAAAGRPGEPWIWTDPKTGTQLPLSYRDWPHTFDPKKLGISNWEMTKQFGGRIPGGGLGMEPSEAAVEKPTEDAEATDGEPTAADADGESTAEESPVNRWPLSGSLEIDCMACHAVPGAYDFNARRLQVEQENFAWAATAGLHLGAVEGNVSRIKDGADPADEATQAKLPKVAYDPSKFSADGTVFMDLIRQPDNNACYQCHSNRTVGESGIDSRWIHDEDVHLRAGMLCTDCHRNGIDHHIVRGFDGEERGDDPTAATLSCAGCHLGADHGAGDTVDKDIYTRAGRLGSPQPLHAGLPPLHFEKLSCTACHGGPAPREAAIRVMTSLAHGLGSKGHRTGSELPAMVGPVFTKGPDGRVYPQRAMWPAFWGVMKEGKVEPISPNQVYEITRRALRVRKDFVTDLLQPKLSSGDMKEILGEDRAKIDAEEWTDEERAKVDAKQAEEGLALFNEKVAAALEAIEKELEAEQAVYVSSGIVYARGDEDDSLQRLEVDDPAATGMVSWPIAHNVRPAGWSLGIGGCVECHGDSGMIFASTVAAVGPGPDVGDSVTMATLQGVAADQRLAWNELFRGRKSFKYIVAASVTVLIMTIMVGIGALASRFAGRNRSTS